MDQANPEKVSDRDSDPFFYAPTLEPPSQLLE